MIGLTGLRFCIYIVFQGRKPWLDELLALRAETRLRQIVGTNSDVMFLRSQIKIEASCRNLDLE